PLPLPGTGPEHERAAFFRWLRATPGTGGTIMQLHGQDSTCGPWARGAEHGWMARAARDGELARLRDAELERLRGEHAVLVSLLRDALDPLQLSADVI